MNKIENITVGDQLRQTRKAIKMSSGRLAELCNVKSSYISRIENGYIDNPSYVLINKAIIGITNELISMSREDRSKYILKLNDILDTYDNSIIEYVLDRLRSKEVKEQVKHIDVLDKTKMIIDKLKDVKSMLDIGIEDLIDINI